MSFIQYASTQSRVSLKTGRDSIGLKIPISTDCFFML